MGGGDTSESPGGESTATAARNYIARNIFLYLPAERARVVVGYPLALLVALGLLGRHHAVPLLMTLQSSLTPETVNY